MARLLQQLRRGVAGEERALQGELRQYSTQAPAVDGCAAGQAQDSLHAQQLLVRRHISAWCGTASAAPRLRQAVLAALLRQAQQNM